jgi:hypothetical protein
MFFLMMHPTYVKELSGRAKHVEEELAKENFMLLVK